MLHAFIPTHYSESEGSPYVKWTYGPVTVSALAKHINRGQKIVKVKDVPVHALVKISQDDVIELRWDCVNGFTKLPTPKKEADSDISFPMPTKEGKVIRILDQTFFVISAGSKPDTVKLYGPHDGHKLSTRTVNWRRFLTERIRIL